MTFSSLNMGNKEQRQNSFSSSFSWIRSPNHKKSILLSSLLRRLISSSLISIITTKAAMIFRQIRSFPLQCSLVSSLFVLLQFGSEGMHMMGQGMLTERTTLKTPTLPLRPIPRVPIFAVMSYLCHEHRASASCDIGMSLFLYGRIHYQR